MLVRRGKGAARSCDGSFLAMLAAIVLSALALCGSASPLALSPSRILVGYTRDGIAAAPALERHLGARLVATIRPLYVRVLELSPGELTGALDALRHDPAVRYAQREGVVRALRIPNDAFWSTQWSPLKTRAPLAWDLTTGSKDVVIAVVDTGVDPAQPDLLGKLVQGYDYVENDASPGDDNGHGTAVAGIVGANSNNGIGVAGYCWRCLIMPVKVLEADGTGSTIALAQGIVWATDHGARVINASLGGLGEDLTVAGAAEYARQHGVLVVAAAGNDSSTVLDYPAALPSVVSVGASDEGDQLYSFSNSGASLAAPGENSSIGENGTYVSFLGTSSAAPVVSGIAGLALSAAPGATPSQVQQALETTAVPMGGVVHGRVDARATVAALAPWLVAPPPNTKPDPNPTRKPDRPPNAPNGRTGETKVLVGKLSGSRHTRTFMIEPGAGLLRVALMAKGARVPIRLRLFDRTGALVAAATGTKAVRLRVKVRAVSYRLIVQANNHSPLTLRITVSYPARSR